MPTNITPRNAEGQAHGLWEYYYSNESCYKGEYVNGIEHGPWESYWYNGVLLYKGTYDMGKEVGLWIWKSEKRFYAN